MGMYAQKRWDLWGMSSVRDLALGVLVCSGEMGGLVGEGVEGRGLVTIFLPIYKITKRIAAFFSFPPIARTISFFF